MQERPNPFHDVPSKYERYLAEQMDVMMDALGTAFLNQKKLEERIKAHEEAHSAANRAAMDMPAVSKDGKPN